MISIVILSYNHEKYIAETLESVYQLNIPKEVIVIDDCSKDSSLDVIRNIVSKHDASMYTKIVAKEINRGLVDSLNSGLEMANSEFVYFIASDDLVESEGFKLLYDELCNNDSAQFAMGNAWVFYTGQKSTEFVYKKQHDVFFSGDDASLRKKIFTNFPKPLLLQATIFRTQALKDVGGWDKTLFWDDYPMFVKLFQSFSLSKNEFLFRKGLIVSKYRQHDSNAYKNFTKQLDIVEKAIKKLAPSELYNTAISRQYAFYVLLAVKSGDYKTAKYIAKKILRQKILFSTIFYICAEVIQWVHRKRK
ncbi:glycosyltransferase family A protein [Enterobacter asburiae]|uniref:glycosyltransferase family A protein n=1 Tax=Enterobacter asburiae TaxID=61645 RepID=UPI00403E5CF3